MNKCRTITNIWSNVNNWSYIWNISIFHGKTRINCRLSTGVAPFLTRTHATANKQVPSSDPEKRTLMRAIDLARKIQQENKKTDVNTPPVPPQEKRVVELKQFSQQLQNVHPNVLAKHLNKSVLFQNGDLVVINKPYGIPVQGNHLQCVWFGGTVMLLNPNIEDVHCYYSSQMPLGAHQSPLWSRSFPKWCMAWRLNLSSTPVSDWKRRSRELFFWQGVRRCWNTYKTSTEIIKWRENIGKMIWIQNRDYCCGASNIVVLALHLNYSRHHTLHTYKLVVSCLHSHLASLPQGGHPRYIWYIQACSVQSSFTFGVSSPGWSPWACLCHLKGWSTSQL